MSTGKTEDEIMTPQENILKRNKELILEIKQEIILDSFP